MTLSVSHGTQTPGPNQSEGSSYDEFQGDGPHVAATKISLNEEQMSAATFGSRPDLHRPFVSSPLLVIAGAGTGKTQTLSHRAAHLIVNGVDPNRILLLTFSRRAAVEMTRRAETIVREQLASTARSSRLSLDWSGTFHSMGNRVLRDFHANIGLSQQFSILDRGDAADLMDVCRHELKLSAAAKRFPRKETCLAIYSRVVNTQMDLTAVLQAVFPWCADWEDELKSLFRAFVKAKQRTESLDYDDLLLYWHHLMAEPELARAVGGRFDHVLVDEYQDTNVLQASIIKAMKPDGSGVTVVGDDAQSIYSFRAANIENILGFPAQYTPAAQVIKLVQNYRSSQLILDAANALMKESQRTYQKELRSDRSTGPKPQFVTLEDDHAQAGYVVERVLANRESGQLLRNQAVLFRASDHADALEVELIRRDIPYRKYGGLKFLEAAHVKDLLAVLRWADNPRNQVAAFRVCQLIEGIGPKVAEAAFSHLESRNWDLRQLAQFAPKNRGLDKQNWLHLSKLLEALIDDDTDWQGQVATVSEWYAPILERRHEGVAARLSDLEQLAAISGRFSTREQFLSELTLDPPQMSSDQSGDSKLDEDYLDLSTIHSAKGQEWESVFVLNVADGNLPSEFATGDPAKTEEERRLTYVAMTRAKTQLHMLAPLKFYTPEQPKYGGRHVYGTRSRFFTDAMMPLYEESVWPPAFDPVGVGLAPPKARVDIAEKLLSGWD
ncbi:MAG: ATP-dependent helicase [Pseudomonadota bacterium]